MCIQLLENTIAKYTQNAPPLQRSHAMFGYLYRRIPFIDIDIDLYFSLSIYIICIKYGGKKTIDRKRNRYPF